MSAYMVDRHHIAYLVAAASSRSILRGCNLYFANQQFGQCESKERETEIGQMLWDENFASVTHRYDDCDFDHLPGPIGESYVYEQGNLHWHKIDPVQVIKSCDNYAYQSCEHPGWEASVAKAFIDELRASAWHSLPGYEGAEWGAPEPDGNVMRLSQLR